MCVMPIDDEPMSAHYSPSAYQPARIPDQPAPAKRSWLFRFGSSRLPWGHTEDIVPHGSLVLWFPLKGQEHDTYGPDKNGWVLMVNPGGGISSMAQWDCVRSYMKVGPEVVALENLRESLTPTRARRARRAYSPAHRCW
jgi:hypothetical protein